MACKGVDGGLIDSEIVSRRISVTVGASNSYMSAMHPTKDGKKLSLGLSIDLQKNVI